MKIFQDFNQNDFIESDMEVTCIGAFDGLHKGHIELINIKNGELMKNSLFKTKDTYTLLYEDNVVATYKPFNEQFFKPDKVII